MSTVNAGWRGPNIVRDGLILYLDAASGTSYSPYVNPGTWRDISGIGNNGTLTNGSTYSSDNGGSIVFDGVDDYFQSPYNPIYNFQYSSSFTVESFVYMNENTGYGYIITNRASNDGSGTIYAGWGILNQVGTLLAFIGGYPSNTFDWRVVNISTTNFNNIVYQKWSHIVWTNDGNQGTGRLYINGTNLTSQSYDDNTPPYVINYNGTQKLTIGRSDADGPSHYLNGRVSVARIYNKALTAAEVLQNFNATRARFGL